MDKNWISLEEANLSWRIDIFSDIIGHAPSHWVKIKLTIDILLSNCFSVITSPSKFVNENDGTCPMIPILSILDLVALSMTKNPKDPSIKINKNATYLTDVLFDEINYENDPLLDLDNVFVTPHVASRNYETVERQANMAIDNLTKSLLWKKRI